MKSCLAALCIVLGAPNFAAAAESTSPAEGMRLLSKMANAARELNYTGTFVYRHGNQIETSRIWHLNDATGDYERLETLDGPPREIVRTNGDVTCYYPGSKTAKMDRFASGRRFPAVVSEQLASIMSNYNVRRGPVARVAGHDCRIAILEPKDNLRYGHVFCAELKSGLPLRAKTINEHKETVEVFAFTQVDIGADIPRSKVEPSYDVTAPGWKVEQSLQDPTAEADRRWSVLSPPSGFRKVSELKRHIQGKATAQIVFSDGLAAVSVFIEPSFAAVRSAQELSRQGAINIFTRSQGDHVVTVLGEAPAATVMRFANSVSVRSKSEAAVGPK